MKITVIIAGTHFTTDDDGYLPVLHAYLVRDTDTGRIVTIPVD